MTARTRWIPALVSGALVLWLASGLQADSKKSASKKDVMKSLELFTRVFERINNYYVEEDVDPNDLIKKAIEGMLEGLDPHSQFLDDRMYDDLMTSTQGSFGGLGIQISVRNNYPTVISPIEGTPAFDKGIQGGDQIIEIEGADTFGWAIHQAIQKLRGPKGSEVSFKVRRVRVAAPIDFTIVRDIIEVESVPYAFSIGNVGYIRIVNFSQDTAEELENRLVELETEGIEGLILDLRYNPGGLLRAARDVSQLFLDSGKRIVYTRGRTPRQNADYYSTTPQERVHGADYPVIVLINGASASASEIVAGALQDWDSALIVGEPSFGKGSVQTVYPLSETEALKITTAKYYTPSGRCIHKDERELEDEADEVAVRTENTEVIEDVTVPETEKFEGPVFHTVGGRIVTASGGIVPDIVIEQPDASSFAIDMERKGFFFQFAIRWVADHAESKKDFEVTPKVLDSFKAILVENEYTYEPAVWDENETFVERGLRREVARRLYGPKAEYLVRIEGDEQLKRALNLFRHGRTLKEFYAVKAENLEPMATEEIKRQATMSGWATRMERVEDRKR